MDLSEQEKLDLAYSYLSDINLGKEEAQEKALEVLARSGNGRNKFYLKGFIKEQNKDYTGALEDYKKSLSFTGITNEEKAIIKNQIGETYNRNGEKIKAYIYFKQAHQADGNVVYPIENLIDYFKEKKDEKSVEKYTKKLNDL